MSRRVRPIEAEAEAAESSSRTRRRRTTEGQDEDPIDPIQDEEGHPVNLPTIGFHHLLKFILLYRFMDVHADTA